MLLLGTYIDSHTIHLVLITPIGEYLVRRPHILRNTLYESNGFLILLKTWLGAV